MLKRFLTRLFKPKKTVGVHNATKEELKLEATDETIDVKLNRVVTEVDIDKMVYNPVYKRKLLCLYSGSDLNNLFDTALGNKKPNNYLTAVSIYDLFKGTRITPSESIRRLSVHTTSHCEKGVRLHPMVVSDLEEIVTFFNESKAGK